MGSCLSTGIECDGNGQQALYWKANDQVLTVAKRSVGSCIAARIIINQQVLFAVLAGEKCAAKVPFPPTATMKK